MPAISSDITDKIDSLKTLYGDKITSENQFVVFLISELQAKVDKLSTDVEEIRRSQLT
jgi:hypothetical protein